MDNILNTDQLVELYLDFLNNWLTKEAFASAYGLNYDMANAIIHQGRQAHARLNP